MSRYDFFQSRIFRKTLVSYFCLFLVPICVLGTVLFSNLYQNAQQQAYAASRTAWEKTTDLLENQFRLIDEAKIQLFSQAWAVERSPDSPEITAEDALTKADYVKQLKLIVSTSSTLRECAVCFPQERYVISSRVEYPYSDYNRYLERTYGLTITPEAFQGLAAAEHYVENGQNLAVLFSLQISMEPQAYGLLVFNQEAVQKSVAEWLGDGGLTVSGVEKVFLKINGESSDGWDFEKASQYTNFTYYASFPAKVGIPFRQMLPAIGGVALLLVCGEILAYLLAGVTYKPLYALFHDNIFSKNFDTDEYQSIQMLLNDTVAENIIMRENAKENLPVLHNEILRKLLKGFFSSQQEIQQQMERYQIPFAANHFFCVLIIKVPQLTDTVPSHIIQDELQAFCLELPYAAQWLETIAGEYIVILGMEDARPDTGLIGSQLRQQLYRRLGNPVLLFRGETQQGIIGISISFQSAKAAMLDGDAAAKAEELPKNFYFPSDWERQLADAVLRGESEIVRRILYQMLMENQKKYLLEEHSEDVIGAVFHLVEQVLLENALSLQENREAEYQRICSLSGEERWLELVEYVAAAAQKIYEARNKNTSLKAYVDENYCSSSMSLKELCQHFQMSESMVSKAFKAETGENFYHYLTHKRMTKAKELLLSHCYDVQTIAAMTGYESRNSFTRAFIRIEGVKPSEFV